MIDYVIMCQIMCHSKSHPKKRKVITDRHQKSLTDSESINDIGQPLLESSVIQSSALSASTEGISNEDLSLTFHVSTEKIL